MNRSTSLVRCLILLVAILLADSRLPGAVRRVHVPENGISPDIAVGASGTVYLVYGKDRNAFFAVSRDDGETFSPPVRLNSPDHAVLAGHERGPKIAIGNDESVYVVWMDDKSTRLEYTRSGPGDANFTPPRNLREPGEHLDGRRSPPTGMATS